MWQFHYDRRYGPFTITYNMVATISLWQKVCPFHNDTQYGLLLWQKVPFTNTSISLWQKVHPFYNDTKWSFHYDRRYAPFIMTHNMVISLWQKVCPFYNDTIWSFHYDRRYSPFTMTHTSAILLWRKVCLF